MYFLAIEITRRRLASVISFFALRDRRLAPGHLLSDILKDAAG